MESNQNASGITSRNLHLHSTEIEYCANPADLFQSFEAHLRPNTALLESADLKTRSSLKSILVLQGAIEVECRGQSVIVTALNQIGQELLAPLSITLEKYLDHSEEKKELRFEFPPSNAAEEEERLLAPNPLEVLRQLSKLVAEYLPGELPTLVGGFGYDFIDTYEELIKVPSGPNNYPDYSFILPSSTILIDHPEKRATLYQLSETVEAPAPLTLKKTENNSPEQETKKTVLRVETISDMHFQETVENLQKHIAAGDIYQVVPSRTFVTECANPFAAYLELRAQNPSPYMFYLNGKNYTLLGASPESYLKYNAENRKTELYPIAGTRPRGKDENGNVNTEQDIRAELSLKTDAKELAEHIMLVDLARNDLARIGQPGSRKVEKLLDLDRYSQVMHLVSKVTCTLAPQYDALDAYRACMNMGTLTGAPKISATNLLRQAEKVGRGSYGGAVGYLSANGSFDTCIVIRSAYVTNGRALVQAGAGVVRDSYPPAEADETYHKASAVLLAIAKSQNAILETAR
ncbi:anthranilate synthase component 1 [Actinomycetaceae bacterium TAE3-ERU4]|nr:anthranilate synthase component 1 [Actinomycetaceae bacterium TAE3-ERU4]